MKLARAAAVAALLLAFPAVASAQQPSTVNPTAAAVQEKQLLEALKPNEAVVGRVSIPDAKLSKLIQPEGRDYRAERDSAHTIGGYVILAFLAAVALFYLVRGPVKLSHGRSGRTITRFGGLDRFTHWLTATSFLLLALTGLNLAFGRALVLPLVGPDSFTALTQAGKFVHNYVSFAFSAGLVLMFLLWAIDNLPSGRDLSWFAQGGGLVGNAHPPADRFNGGQKLIFWSVVGLGGAIAVTGYILMFPFQGTTIFDLQWANIWHGLLGLILFGIIVGHIYIGSLGMEGAFAAMGSGEVDENWAREHHSVWVDKVAKKSGSGKVAPAE